jgi:Ca2+-binding EF-hand superfamily protein
MSKINIHPTDRIATFQEVSKQIGMFTVVILIFIFVFFIPMSQGMMSTETCNDITQECELVDDDIFSVIIGYALSGCFSLILIAIWSQVLMVIIGKGKFVVDENNSVTLRTSKSGIRSSSSIQNMIMNRMAKGFMSSADLDGDGKISYEEAIDMYFEDASKSEKPWEWDFKEAYERISKRFDLPPGNDPISYDDYCVYTDSEDRTEFDKVDTDNDGIITKEQFIEMIWKGGNSELNEIKTHFEACDEDGDGFLSVEELAKFMTGQDDNWAEKKPEVEEKSDNWWSEEDN